MIIPNRIKPMQNDINYLLKLIETGDSIRPEARNLIIQDRLNQLDQGRTLPDWTQNGKNIIADRGSTKSNHFKSEKFREYKLPRPKDDGYRHPMIRFIPRVGGRGM